MFGLSSQSGRQYFLLVLTGEVTGSEFCAAHSFMCEMVRRRTIEDVLLDITSISIALSPTEQQAVFEHLSATMPPLRRVAIAHHLEAAYHLVRAVATAHGIEVGEFTSLRDAELWLTQAAG